MRGLFPFSAFSQSAAGLAKDPNSDAIIAGFAKAPLYIPRDARYRSVPAFPKYRVQDLMPVEVRLVDITGQGYSWPQELEGDGAVNKAAPGEPDYWVLKVPMPPDMSWVQVDDGVWSTDSHGGFVITDWDGNPVTIWEAWYPLLGSDGQWTARMMCRFNPQAGDRQRGWNRSSANGFGGPMAAYMVGYDECLDGPLTHGLGLELSVQQSLPWWSYPSPATHLEGSLTKNGGLLGHGCRLVLNPDYPIAKFNVVTQRLLQAMKDYGLFVVDRGYPFALRYFDDARWQQAFASPSAGKSVADELRMVTADNFYVTTIGKQCNYQYYPGKGF